MSKTSVLIGIAGIFLALAFFASNGFANDTISSTALQDTQLYGRAYTPNCLSDCHLVFKVNFGASADLTKSAAESYEKSFKNDAGSSVSGCILESHYDILVNESMTEKVWKPDVKCSVVNNKTTGKDENVCTDNGAYQSVPSWAMVWRPLKDFKPAEKGKDYYIDLVAKKSLAPGCRKVDAIPTILGQELKQYAWWNNGWTYYKNITLTAGDLAMVNNTIPINVSWTANMAADFSDLRFVSDGNSELSYWIEKNVSSSYADVWVRVLQIDASSSAVISMYYGNVSTTTTSSGTGTWLHYDDFAGQAVGSNPTDWSITEGGSTKIDVVSNVSKFGNRAVIYTGDGASQAESSYSYTFPKKFRYKSWTQIGVAVDGVYENLKEGGTIDVNTRYVAGPKWVYYLGGTGNIQLGGAWTSGVWYGTQILSDAATDLANYTWDGNVAVNKAVRTAYSTINTIYYTGPDGAAGTNYLGAVMVGNYSGSDPTYSFGAEQTLPSGSSAIILASNTTNGWSFKNGQLFNTNITAWNTSALGSVSQVYIEFNGVNNTAASFGSDIFNWNGTLSGVKGGTYTIKQYAQNNSAKWYTNTSTYFDISVLAGLNLSLVNGGNGTAITAWSVDITNTTAIYSASGLSNPSFIDWSLLPRGSVSVKFFKTGFKNASFASVVNTTQYTSLTGQVYSYSDFRAKNKDTGGAVSTFSLSATNGTATYSGSTTTGSLLAGLDELPTGNVAFTTSASQYALNTTNYTINGNTQLNTTAILQPAGLGVQAYLEATGAVLPFNITISNSTASWTISSSETSLYIMFSNTSLPIGDDTFIISSTGYGSRTYYGNVNDHAFVNVSAWLLAGGGSPIRFHTITSVYSGIPGVLVRANRTISGVNILIGEQLSDASGTAVLYLDPAATYTISASKTGYTSYSGSIMPSSSDYNIIMNSLTSNETINTPFSDITYILSPSSGGLTNNTGQVFNFSVLSTNNSLCSYGMNITLNGTVVYSANASSPSGGFLNYTANLANYSGTQVNVYVWLVKCGFDTFSVNNTYNIYAEAPSASSLSTILAGLKAGICPVPTDVNGIIWCLPLNVIALLVSSIAGGTGAAKYSVNGGGAAFLATLWLFMLIGFFPFAITLILTLLVIAVMAWRSGL